jgi:ribosomal protein S18 acetylase RimI-like enzyme
MVEKSYMNNLIRNATHDDIKKMQNMVLSLVHLVCDETIPDWFADTLSEKSFFTRISSDDFEHFIYEINNNIVGFIAIKNDEHIYHLFVDQAYQGRGIAKALWQHTKSQSSSSRFSVNSSIFAVDIYKAFGFQEIGEIQNHNGVVFQQMKYGD